jgi:hypothetical protein
MSNEVKRDSGSRQCDGHAVSWRFRWRIDRDGYGCCVCEYGAVFRFPIIAFSLARQRTKKYKAFFDSPCQDLTHCSNGSIISALLRTKQLQLVN